MTLRERSLPIGEAGHNSASGANTAGTVRPHAQYALNLGADQRSQLDQPQ